MGWAVELRLGWLKSLSLIRVESDLYFDAFLPLKKFICAGLILLVRYKP